MAEMKPKETEKLEQEVGIAVGMEAMVVINITTEADLANGTRGKVVELVGTGPTRTRSPQQGQGADLLMIPTSGGDLQALSWHFSSVPRVVGRAPADFPHRKNTFYPQKTGTG